MREIWVMIVAAGWMSAAGGPTAWAAQPVPVFSLAWSEYPSWSAFGVAHEYHIIDGRRGKLGSIEEKWGVDIELKEADYDTCIVMYGSKQCDAACLTNMDSLAPGLARASVAILPTSTSDGADACIVTQDITDVKQLKAIKVYGLAKTVSEYTFVRNLELLGEAETDYRFTNMDPGAAALAMQQKQAGFNAIVVWNPFVLETLNKRRDAHVLFDSTSIRGEIIDMVTMAQDALDRPKGAAFACALVEAFYEVNKKIADPSTRDDALMALGEKFSHLDLKAMKKVVQQTKFYATPDAGLTLFTGDELKATMEKVVKFCVDHEIVGRKPEIAFGSETAKVALRFDPQYLATVKGGN